MRALVQLLVVIALLGASALVAKWLVDSRPEPEPRAVVESAPLVEVHVVRVAPFQRTVRARGEVVPREESVLVPEVSGRVRSVSPVLVSGGAYATGDVLVELDARDYDLAVVSAEALVLRAETALVREEAEAELAIAELARLGETDPGPLAAREPQLAEARAAAAAARADLSRARLDLERTRLRAPFTGRVRSETVGVGQYVVPGQVLAELFSTDVAEVRLAIVDEELAQLDRSLTTLTPSTSADARANGPEVRLWARFAGEPREWRGRVARVEAELDSRSRMVTLVVEVREPYGRSAEAGVPLFAGLFVEAEIEGRREAEAILIPRRALVRADEVLVVDDESRLRSRTVTVGWRDEERVLVTAGLRAGERVCVSPLPAPVDGMRVEVPIERATGAEESAK